MKAKKSYGQNFLINESISQRIVDTFIDSIENRNVLEVGPGRGALTKYFLKQSEINFKAVEADWDMIHFLQQEYGMSKELLIQQDFLKLPLEKVFDHEEYNVIGNFPYNISSQILFRIDKYKDCIPMVVGMFQKEVAERIASGPGNKVYGLISVLIQASYDPKVLFTVSPSSFYPAPKVTSAVLQLRRKKDYDLPCDKGLFKTVVKTSFNQRRKMLRNTLKPMIKSESFLSSAMMSRRPEELSLEEFIELTQIIEKENK